MRATFEGESYMLTKSGLPAIVIAVALAGCGGQDGFRPTGFGGGEPMPLTPGCNNTGSLCVVQVNVTGDCTNPANITVNPDVLTVGNSGARRVLWIVDNAAGYKFCQGSGDGVYLQPWQRNQFEFARATNNKDGSEDNIGDGELCRDAFRVRNWNSDRKTTDYRYFLQFTGPGGAVCKKDPWIRNG
jgi:hypothetical protein